VTETPTTRTARPTKRFIAFELVALAAVLALAAALAPRADWDLPLLALLAVFGVVSDAKPVQLPGNRNFASGGFLAIVTVAVLLGATPAVIVALITILSGWATSRYSLPNLLINLLTYAAFSLLTALAFEFVVERFALVPDEPGYYLAVLGAFVWALAANFLMIAGYTRYEEGTPIRESYRAILLPILPSELATALLAVAIAFAYSEIGTVAIALFGVVLLIFQYLLGALLISQERAKELELRAHQLAGFQVALLSALLRTLDLRDKMTARHSAAVARYARELAARAGLSGEEQELAHTAGLLHDIGKFILPDDILKADKPLTEEDWEKIKRHPIEGAKIVSEIDGYRPVGEIILAHHERIDGLGYPRGLIGDEIPEIARIIAVVDTYDVMTARDSYREPCSPEEAIAELREVAGTQLDARFVELFIELLEEKGVSFQHGSDADFEAELQLERRIEQYLSLPRRRPLRTTAG
jgi:putative nucleotidyltransferase with HDIG domain